MSDAEFWKTTGELRFLETILVSNDGIRCNTSFIPKLQQKWIATDSFGMFVKEEWRDVPMVRETINGSDFWDTKK